MLNIYGRQQGSDSDSLDPQLDPQLEPIFGEGSELVSPSPPHPQHACLWVQSEAPAVHSFS